MASRLAIYPQVSRLLVPTRYPYLIAYRVFHVVISNLDELSEPDEISEKKTDNHSISPDDYKECDYLLRTASNIISALSHNGWIALLTHVLGNEKRLEATKSEGG
jgi:hypothetical protein